MQKEQPKGGVPLRSFLSPEVRDKMSMQFSDLFFFFTQSGGDPSDPPTCRSGVVWQREYDRINAGLLSLRCAFCISWWRKQRTRCAFHCSFHIYGRFETDFPDSDKPWRSDRSWQRLCGLGKWHVLRRALGGGPSFRLLGREAELQRSHLREHGPVRCGYVTWGWQQMTDNSSKQINTRECALCAGNIRMADLGVTDVGRSRVR